MGDGRIPTAGDVALKGVPLLSAAPGSSCPSGLGVSEYLSFHKGCSALPSFLICPFPNLLQCWDVPLPGLLSHWPTELPSNTKHFTVCHLHLDPSSVSLARHALCPPNNFHRSASPKPLFSRDRGTSSDPWTGHSSEERAHVLPICPPRRGGCEDHEF